MLITTQTVNAARERCQDAPAWLRAIDRAALLLPASTVEQLPAGRLRIVSANSGAAYVASVQACTCTAATNGRPCWHRAAARLAALEARALRCRYCRGRMVESTTIAGEVCYTCEACGHEAMRAAVTPGQEVA